MALSEISTIREALDDNVPLDIINEIATFLPYTRCDLQDIPGDGVARIFMLNMKIVFFDHSKNFHYDGDVNVIRSKDYHDFNFKFTTNETSWNLIYGVCYPHRMTFSKGPYGVEVCLLSHKFD